MDCARKVAVVERWLVEVRLFSLLLLFSSKVMADVMMASNNFTWLLWTKDVACCILVILQSIRLNRFRYRVFSHEVTSAILVSQNNETAAMLVSQTSPLGVELFSYANAFFSSNKFA